MYKKLFSPIVLANQEIKNRIAMAPMGCTRESQYYDGKVSTELIDYFEARAKGGVGMIISPFTAVDKRYYTLTLGLFSREHILGISRLVEAVHVFGCKFILQLSHFGGKSPKGFEYGRDPIAPSSIESRMYPVVPKGMSISQIEEIINLFIQCGRWAKDGDCDGVELHGAHGYLINQFVSPHSNRRDDEYGGTLEKRLNFLTKIAKAIREKCGDDFIIGFKFSAHEHLEGGINTEVAKQIAKFIDNQGILDYIHVSAHTTLLPGFLDCDYPSVPPIYTPNPLVPLAEKIKKEVKIPIMATGGINDPGYAEKIITEGKADMVAIGRALIADAEWANKAKSGGSIKYCIKCNTCYLRGMNQKSIKCSVNPYVGEERRYGVYTSGKALLPKKVLIIGAGPAGMEAALVANQRGHKVIIVEENNKIGGLLRISSIPDFKVDVLKLLSYYENEIIKNSIELRLGIRATPEYILNENMDIVILAIGANPVVPDIPGIDNEFVFNSIEALENEELITGSDIVVIGAGLVGCEISLHFAIKGKNVKVIDYIKFNEILSNEHPVNRSMIIRRMNKEGVSILPELRVLKITKKGEIKVTQDNKENLLSADNIIVAAGFKPREKLVKELEDKISSAKPELEIYAIGDCVRCDRIFNAVNSGANIAWQI